MPAISKRSAYRDDRYCNSQELTILFADSVSSGTEHSIFAGAFPFLLTSRVTYASTCVPWCVCTWEDETEQQIDKTTSISGLHSI
eukprot:m.2122 g.2122  ORF g.2122 m.2122 type:complete len:85 (+) comp1444_c0_seq1:3-257(+)